MNSTSTRAHLGAPGAALTVALMLGVAGGLAACNFIVGAGKYSVGDAGAAGEGDSSMTDSGGLDQFGPEGGSDVASDVPTDTQVTCGKGLPTSDPNFQATATACMEAIGCSPYVPTPFYTIGQCIAESYLGTHAPSCMATAASCAAVTTCTGLGIATATQCPGGNTVATGTCQGTTAITCGAGTLGVVKDCNAFGASACATYSDGAGGMAADCVVVPSGCTGSGPNCNGSVWYYCQGTLGQGFGAVCTSMNEQCTTLTFDNDAGVYTTCFDNAPTCPAPAATCQGNKLQTCTNGLLFSYDCTKTGLTCRQDSSGAACVAPGCSVAEANGCIESCNPDGVTANFCVGGATYSVNCSTVPGFTRCLNQSVSGSTLKFVECSP